MTQTPPRPKPKTIHAPNNDVGPRAALAHELGVSRALITRVLDLPNLSAEVKKTVVGLSDPMPGRYQSQATLCGV